MNDYSYNRKEQDKEIKELNDFAKNFYFDKSVLDSLKSQQSIYKLDWIINAILIDYMQYGIKDKLETRSYQALSSVFNIPSSDIRKIHKGIHSYESFFNNQIH